MQTALKRVAEPITQFELTSNLLRNLYKYDLTPVTKLVLLELTTHLNEVKNGSVVFPSISYIAEVLGIGLTAAKKAINDLIKEGLIIKSKRGNINGNYNKYLLTPKVQNLTSEGAKNEPFKQSDSDLLYIRTNNNEQNKEQRGKINFRVENIPQKYSNKISGGNVYSEEDRILREYAIKHGAKNKDAYINTLKKTKSAEKIIQEYKKKNAPLGTAYNFKTSEQWLRQQAKENALPPCTAASCGYSAKDVFKLNHNNPVSKCNQVGITPPLSTP